MRGLTGVADVWRQILSVPFSPPIGTDVPIRAREGTARIWRHIPTAKAGSRTRTYFTLLYFQECSFSAKGEQSNCRFWWFLSIPSMPDKQAPGSSPVPATPTICTVSLNCLHLSRNRSSRSKRNPEKDSKTPITESLHCLSAGDILTSVSWLKKFVVIWVCQITLRMCKGDSKLCSTKVGYISC